MTGTFGKTASKGDEDLIKSVKRIENNKNVIGVGKR
jgi:hypothetical protein